MVGQERAHDARSHAPHQEQKTRWLDQVRGWRHESSGRERLQYRASSNGEGHQCLAEFTKSSRQCRRVVAVYTKVGRHMATTLPNQRVPGLHVSQRLFLPSHGNPR